MVAHVAGDEEEKRLSRVARLYEWKSVDEDDITVEDLLEKMQKKLRSLYGKSERTL